MITPTIDPVNMLIVMGPLLLLYGLSILMAYAAKPKQPAEAPA
jgi:Sec-independent protein secretion pathway component TatC